MSDQVFNVRESLLIEMTGYKMYRKYLKFQSRSTNFKTLFSIAARIRVVRRCQIKREILKSEFQTKVESEWQIFKYELNDIHVNELSLKIILCATIIFQSSM